jgi:hypothetical protein
VNGIIGELDFAKHMKIDVTIAMYESILQHNDNAIATEYDT